MAFLLRKVDRKAAFALPDWPLDDDDVQAKALQSLQASGNALSVWEVDADRGNLERILAALSANRRNLDKLDYALIDRRCVRELSLSSVPRPGDSLDQGANQQWHQEMTRLSGRGVLRLAVAIRTHAELGRLQKPRVAQLINHSLESGFIRRADVADSILREMGRYLSRPQPAPPTAT